MTEVMVDLETFGTGNNAVIVSIGAAKFDPKGQGVEDSFYAVVDPSSCVQYGLKIDPATVLWWMSEDRNEARKELLEEDMQDLGTALEGFSMWFGSESLPVWGNGSTFDNVILRNAFEATGIECPWKFWHDRCYRTMKSVCPVTLDRQGTHHNALDDAITQALHLQAINETLVSVPPIPRRLNGDFPDASFNITRNQE